MSKPGLLNRVAYAILVRLQRVAQAAQGAEREAASAAPPPQVPSHGTGFSSDTSRWSEQVREYMMRSSPERTRAKEAAGDLAALTSFIAGVGRQRLKAEQDAGRSAAEALASAHATMMEEAGKAVQGPETTTAQAAEREPTASAAAPHTPPSASQETGFSSDTTRWPEEARAYMMQSSPEGTRAKEAAGDLPFVTSFVAAVGQQRLKAEQGAGTGAAEALAAAHATMMEQAGKPVEGPSRICARGDASPPISYPEFARLRTWLQWGPFDDATKDLLVRLVNIISQMPALGRLLDHPMFAADRSDDGVMLDLLLGARAFGDGDLDESIRRFRSVYAKRPEALFALAVANCHRMKGERREALEVLEKALERWPDDAALGVPAAGLAFTLGDIEKANRIFAPWKDAYLARYDHDQNMIKRRAELEEAIREKRLYRKADMDIYDDTFAENTWWNYWFHFNAYTRYQHAEAMLGALVPEHLSAFLRSRSPRPKTCVEVGTMCGELLYRVAVQFPDIHFVGVDRNPVIKRLNDEGYRLPNLEFRADDIINVLDDPKLDFAGAVLFHTRTSPFLLPDFMRKLYGRCREVGFDAISMIEMYSLSIQNRRFQQFEEMPTISEIRGGGLMTHNYPKILGEVGFPKVDYTFVNANTIFSGSDSSVFLTGTR